MTRRPAKGKLARKRGRNGLPSVIERPDGRWAVTVSLGRDGQGKRRRFQTTCATEQEGWNVGMRVMLERGQLNEETRRDLTVSQLLAYHLASRPPGEYSTQVNRCWQQALIGKHLGQMRARDVTADRVNGLLEALRDEGKAPSTVAKCRWMLGMAFRYAVAQGIMPRNPVDAVVPSTVPSRPREEAWTQEELARICRAARKGRLFPLFVTAIATGARVGELIGARVEDYDPGSGLLHIRGTAKRHGGRGKGKSAAAHRACALLPPVQEVLNAHLKEVAGWREQAGPCWGQRQETPEVVRQKQREAAQRHAAHPLPPGWIPEAPPREQYEPLFPTRNGTPWLAGNVGREWRRVLERAELPHRRLHSTRAAYITAALQDPDVSIPDIQVNVGHETAVMTLQYAQHVRGRQQQVAAAAARGLGLDAALADP